MEYTEEEKARIDYMKKFEIHGKSWIIITKYLIEGYEDMIISRGILINKLEARIKELEDQNKKFSCNL